LRYKTIRAIEDTAGSSARACTSEFKVFAHSAHLFGFSNSFVEILEDPT
jgi:hypothetical protein